MSVEELIHTKEFELSLPHEVERKFLPVFPEALDGYRAMSQPIEQYYLSHPTEPFSLRMRESLVDGELCYEATLKDAGVIHADGIDRMEVTAPVTPELYAMYRTPEHPLIRKLRAEPRPGITIDFYDNGSVRVESENPREWEQFVRDNGDMFIETTGDRSSNNEWQAHLSFRRANEGREALVPQPDLDPATIIGDIMERYAEGTLPITLHIGGRSGSGKSTIVHEVRAQLETLGLSSAVMSTDDYHRGNTWLVNHNGGEPWTHWDEAVVYDTGAMAIDLANLQSGERIYRRAIDWTTVEPSFPGIIEPSDVIIIEGIYARSPDITNESDLSYEMTTSLATCIGRRLLRDLRERPEFADPVKSLGYMLSEAEPAYRKQLSGLREQSS